MKKTTVWLMIIAMVICLTGNLQGTKAFAASKGVVNTETLNVREGAGTNYSILTTLARGTEVTILETLSTEWLRVRFKASGTDLEGYVASMYISVSVDKNILAENLQISAKLLSKQTVYKKAKRNANAVTYKKKKVRLQKGCRVTVQGIKKGSGQHWYLLSFTYKKKQLTGYISTDYVKLQSKKKISAYTYKKSNVYTKVGNTKKATCLKKGKNVKIIKEKTVKSKKWFQISYAYGGKTRVGWVLASDVGIRSGKEIIADVPVQVTPTPTPPTDNVILTDAEFEADMVTQGFPESYKPALRELHAANPYWKFKSYQTGLDWSTAVASESILGKSLITNTRATSWKSSAAGAFDYVNDKYIVFDGTSWVNASQGAVAYYMDPRNFMTDKTIFMFEALGYDSSYQSVDGVAAVLSGTPYSGASYTYTDDAGAVVTKTYQDTFIEAAALTGASPIHLASRMRQEVVTGALTVSDSVTGAVAGFEGIYNFYNIGASDSSTGQAIVNGLKFASTGSSYMRPWNNPYKAIVGGAQYIANNYITKGQNTLYLQRFNVTPNNTYNHQYMTNVAAAYSESLKVYTAYQDIISQRTFVFNIPVYVNMPAEACVAPAGNLSPNNYLKAITVTGSVTQNVYNSSPAFSTSDGGLVQYTFSVPAIEGSVSINAEAVNSSATIAGVGTYILSNQTNTITLVVTAADGSVRNYQIIINRI